MTSKTVMNGDHMQYEIENANVPPEQRSDWPLPSFDARDWSKAFCKIAKEKGHDLDEGWMLSWFAASLMRGYDEANARRPAPPASETAPLIAAVNARIPSSVTPATRVEIHPSEWLALVDALESKSGSVDRRMTVALWRSLDRLHLAVKDCARIGFQESSPTTNATHAEIWNTLNAAQADAALKLKAFSQGLPLEPKEQPGLRGALVKACALLRRWRQRESDLGFPDKGDGRLFSETGTFCGPIEAALCVTTGSGEMWEAYKQSAGLGIPESIHRNGEPETAETAARQPDESAASPATRSHRQIDVAVGRSLDEEPSGIPPVQIVNKTPCRICGNGPHHRGGNPVHKYSPEKASGDPKPGDPCPVCASGRIGQSGIFLRCGNCGWMRDPTLHTKGE